jgi:hypothetical protein
MHFEPREIEDDFGIHAQSLAGCREIFEQEKKFADRYSRPRKTRYDHASIGTS